MTDDLKPYQAYKDLGVSWLVRVPEHWEVLPNRVLFTEVKDRDHPDEEMLSVTITRGVIRQQALLTETSKKDSSNLDRSAYKLVQPNDIAYNKMRAWQGAIGVSAFRGIISPAYVVMRPRNASSSQFFHELFRTPAFAKEAERWSYGITSDMWSLRPEHFKMIYSVLPPQQERAAIVRYLDYANRKINRYIHAKNKLIGLLNEQKQAIICRAVTNGIGSDVKLKPSGLPWLGQVPASWQVLSVRRLISFITSGSRGWAKYYSDEGDLFLQSGNLSRTMSLKLDKIQKVQPPTGAEGVRTTVQLDDLLICITGALTGNVSHVNQSLPRCFVNQHVALVRPRKQKVIPRFLAYVLHSPIGQAQFKNSEYGGTKQGLGLDDVRNVQIALPPVEEQERIVRYLDNATDSMVRGICSIERDIDLLREYRIRLVADVVTGKLDVRAAAAKLPDLVPEAEPLDEVDDLLQDERAAEDFEVAEAA